MRSVKQWLALGLLFFTAPALAIPAIQHWQLANGARVYYLPAPELPMVDLRVVFNAGSARDGDRPGLAVLTNGLLAEGAGGLSADEIAEGFERLGAGFSNDALRDMALLELRSLTDPKLLDPAISLLATLLTRPEFPPAAVERERSRMLVAIQRDEQQPDEVADRLIYEAMYGGHPYAHRSIGSRESVGKLTADQLRDFYQRHYVGRNAVIALVGDLSRERAEQLAERVAGALPAGEPVAALPEPPAAAGGEVRRSFPSSQTHLLLGHPALTRHDPDYFPLMVGNHILGGSGLVSLLSQEVREKRGLTYNVYSDLRPMQAQGPFLLGVQTATQNAGEALAVMKKTLADFIEQGPTAEQLSAAKKNITGGFPLGIDSNRELVQFLAMIGFYGLPLDYLDSYPNRVEAVTVEQVHDAFRRRVRPEQMATVVVGAGP